MGVSLYRLHVPSAFGGRARFDMDASHVFPKGVLAAIMVRVGAGNVGVRARVGYEVELPLCSVVITTLLGQGLIPSCWIRPKLAMFPLSVCFSLSSHWDTCPRVGVLKQGGSCVQISLVPHSQSLPLASTASTLLWSYNAGQAGAIWTLNMYWG